MIRTRIWDLPTRLFHWTLAACVIALVFTAKVSGSSAAMEWHYWLGYATLALLLFRLVWGVIGGHWSRFSSFVYSPVTLLRYLKGQDPRPELHAGHSPTGALSVFAILAIVGTQALSGLFIYDDISFYGPLTNWVSNDTISLATRWHVEWGQWLVIGIAVLHVLAIVFYRLVKRQNLVTPMIVGDKRLTSPLPASRDGIGPFITALVVMAACSGFVYWLVKYAAT